MASLFVVVVVDKTLQVIVCFFFSNAALRPQRPYGLYMYVMTVHDVHIYIYIYKYSTCTSLSRNVSAVMHMSHDAGAK